MSSQTSPFLVKLNQIACHSPFKIESDNHCIDTPGGDYVSLSALTRGGTPYQEQNTPWWHTAGAAAGHISRQQKGK